MNKKIKDFLYKSFLMSCGHFLFLQATNQFLVNKLLQRLIEIKEANDKYAFYLEEESNEKIPDENIRKLDLWLEYKEKINNQQKVVIQAFKDMEFNGYVVFNPYAGGVDEVTIKPFVSFSRGMCVYFQLPDFISESISDKELYAIACREAVRVMHRHTYLNSLFFGVTLTLGLPASSLYYLLYEQMFNIDADITSSKKLGTTEGLLSYYDNYYSKRNLSFFSKMRDFPNARAYLKENMSSKAPRSS